MSHQHDFHELGRVPIFLAYGVCRCGRSRIDFVSQTGQRVGATLALRLAKGATRAIELGKESLRMSQEIAELMRRIGGG